ncbi:hypothetical protein WJX74_009428 [Apatococcus lobatus]|uniref:Glycosyl transferase CAP10 domain-containing protein n=1 Tax=Apatococcus lobatus TaxID=904363 RepID=A0AAW1RC18_9CHLO
MDPFSESPSPSRQVGDEEALLVSGHLSSSAVDVEKIAPPEGQYSGASAVFGPGSTVLRLGGLLAGLLFVASFILLYVPRPLQLQSSKPQQHQQQQQPQNPQIHPLSHEKYLLSQVAKDLSPFNDSRISSGISLQQVERVYCNCDQGGFRLQIIDGQMYIVGERHGLQTRVRNTKLLVMHLMHQYTLPDVDIGWVSTDDTVMEADAGRYWECPEQGPVLVMTKQPHHDHCIMYPDFTFWDWEEAYAVPWQDMQKVMKEAAGQEPWKGRKELLFARAFNLGEARNTLKDNEGDLGNHELMDVRIIDWHADPGLFVDLQQHCQYKWLLHTAGNTYSARLKYLLFCKSAVVLPDSPWQEFFYHMLQAGHNVLRVEALTRDNKAAHLPAVARYLQEHDEEAEEIGQAGAAFARKHLSRESVALYYKELIESYAGLMKFKPTVHPDAVPIEKSLLNDLTRPFHERTCNICPRT